MRDIPRIYSKHL